jgi:hypothetical protein
MTDTFISVFYSNAIGRNMGVVSEKLLCHFYTLNRKSNKESLLKFQGAYSNIK